MCVAMCVRVCAQRAYVCVAVNEYVWPFGEFKHMILTVALAICLICVSIQFYKSNRLAMWTNFTFTPILSGIGFYNETAIISVSFPWWLWALCHRNILVWIRFDIFFSSFNCCFNLTLARAMIYIFRLPFLSWTFFFLSRIFRLFIHFIRIEEP